MLKSQIKGCSFDTTDHKLRLSGKTTSSEDEKSPIITEGSKKSTKKNLVTHEIVPEEKFPDLGCYVDSNSMLVYNVYGNGRAAAGGFASPTTSEKMRPSFPANNGTTVWSPGLFGPIHQPGDGFALANTASQQHQQQQNQLHMMGMSAGTNGLSFYPAHSPTSRNRRGSAAGSVIYQQSNFTVSPDLSMQSVPAAVYLNNNQQGVFGPNSMTPLVSNHDPGAVGSRAPNGTNQQGNKDVYWHYNPGTEIYSRKVFVGGLPIDIEEDEVMQVFSRHGPLVTDWPCKPAQIGSPYHSPRVSGYVFLIYEHETSVRSLVDFCHKEEDKFYICISSPTMKDKPVQIRPWLLADADFVVDAGMALDPRMTVFIGGVPRPLKAVELATIMDALYGGVCYAGVDTDPELRYPKGAARVAFNNMPSYIAAISGRFVQLRHVDKRVEVKPYVLDDQMCDECEGKRCGGKYASFFCAEVSCLQYYCEMCWAHIHSRPGREYHKPLVKESAENKRRAAVKC